MSSLGGLKDAAKLLFLQRSASAERNAGERVVGDGDGKAGLVAQHLVETLQERSSTGQDDALVADIGGKLGRSVLKSDANAFDDSANRLGECFGNLALVDRDF